MRLDLVGFSMASIALRCCVAWLLVGSAILVHANEPYQPKLGQPGKDVMWLPTQDALMQRMLEVARVGPQDLVFDLGAGDGKIAIAAAKQFGARAVGIEYNARLAELAQRQVTQAGVNHLVKIIQGDIFKEDFSSATVLTLYLLDELNQMLRPTVLSMKPGTRVVSTSFAMGDWEPDEVIQVSATEDRYRTPTGYYWMVPARIEGQWQLNGWPESNQDAPAILRITQRYQRVAGTFTFKGVTQPLLGAQLKGSELSFSCVDAQGALKWVRARVQKQDAQEMTGEILGAYGQPETPVGPWEIKATRIRP
jgi:SAM-dependent methyltransferase